jgi:beta-galactosidase GanA
MARSDGITVPFTFNAPQFTSGTGAVNISGQDSYPLFATDCGNPTRHFGNPPTLTVSPGEPFMTPEEQNGSLENWGAGGYDDCYTLTGPGFENVYYKYNIAQGITVQSNYMGAGGTNWGWLPYPQGYTSYDYGAPIHEDGEIGTPSDPNDIAGSKFGEDKLINDFETSVAPLTKTVQVAAPVRDNAAVTAMSRANPDDRTQFIYLRQASGGSTATTATHLSLDLDQNGSYSYDDTAAALSYSGDWSPAGPSTAYYWDYGQTETSTNQAGASVTLSFSGTAVQWIGPQNTNGGIADVYIDGGLAGTVDTYTPAGKQFQQVLFGKTGLAAGSHTLQIVATGQKDAASSGTYVSLDAINIPDAAQQAGYYPVVPQQGAITLEGQDARMLLANYDFDGQHLVYSTSELMTHASIGGRTVAVAYDPAGTDGETVLRYGSQPTVRVLQGGNVTNSWDPSRNDLRLDYVHNGLTEVQITGGGRPPLLLLVADTNTAEGFWPEQTSAGPVLVQGGYLVRTAAVKGAGEAGGGTLELTGDTSKAGSLVVWGGSGVRSVNWNGTPVAVTRGADGSLSGTVPGPAPVTLPALTNWRFTSEAAPTQPGFDDSSWTLADHPVSTYSSTAAATPVLYAADYGYDHGFVWYRGHFTATGSETGVTLTADGIAPTGAFSVWLNGTFLGSHTAAGATQASFSFPAGALRAGQDNVIAVLTENTGNPEGSSAERSGLYSATLEGSSAPVTWRLLGDSGGTTLQDPVRGPLNATGLYGTNHGWDLPGYPDQGWQQVTVPDSWSGRGVSPGVGWYRTTFSLNLPRSGYVPVDVQIGGPGPGAGTADYRAFIFVNGWLIGLYVNNVGPQHQFYVPAGILSEHGENTLAIAVWGLNAAGGGIDGVSLVAEGNQAGGVPVQQVPSPGYTAAVYGPPSRS